MGILLDDTGVSKLSAKVFFFLKWTTPLIIISKNHYIRCDED